MKNYFSFLCISFTKLRFQMSSSSVLCAWLQGWTGGMLVTRYGQVFGNLPKFSVLIYCLMKYRQYYLPHKCYWREQEVLLQRNLGATQQRLNFPPSLMVGDAWSCMKCYDLLCHLSFHRLVRMTSCLVVSEILLTYYTCEHLTRLISHIPVASTDI